MVKGKVYGRGEYYPNGLEHQKIHIDKKIKKLT